MRDVAFFMALKIYDGGWGVGGGGEDEGPIFVCALLWVEFEGMFEGELETRPWSTIPICKDNKLGHYCS